MRPDANTAKTYRLSEDELQHLIEMVKRACIDRAVERHTDALMDGLCAEGAWDCAMDAVRGLTPEETLQSFLSAQNSSR